MFDDLPRNTLVRLKDGNLFLIKCKICQTHSMEEVCCYIGHRYKNKLTLDYDPFTCYYDMIESIMRKN